MSITSRSWVRRSLPVLLSVAALAACSTGVEPAKSPSTTSATETSQATTTIQAVDDISDSDFGGNDDDLDAGEGAPYGVWLKFGGQTFDIEHTACKVDDSDVTVVGQGKERTSGEDAYLDMKIEKPDRFSEGTVTLIVGASAPGGAGKVFTAKIGEGSDYSVSTFDVTAEIEAELTDDAGKSAGTAEFSITCI